MTTWDEIDGKPNWGDRDRRTISNITLTRPFVPGQDDAVRALAGEPSTPMLHVEWPDGREFNGVITGSTADGQVTATGEIAGQVPSDGEWSRTKQAPEFDWVEGGLSGFAQEPAAEVPSDG